MIRYFKWLRTMFTRRLPTRDRVWLSVVQVGIRETTER